MNSLKYIVPIVLLCVVVAVTVPLVVVSRESPADVVEEGPLVITNVGPIRGLAATGPGGDYSMFLGIPYATVNASNPFGPSIPHEGFDDTFNAFDDSVMCLQMDGTPNGAMGILDCLQLHVYVPKTASSVNRLPVMVWIHGGAFTAGFASRSAYDPVFLVAHDVIVVTLTYRVGVYGFLCLDIPEVPGNQGLKDQLTALRWVKNNIEAFGGDTTRITIFGESAGGISVDLHYIYAQEELFNNVIIQSGTALSFHSYNASNPGAASQLVTHLGHNAVDVYDAIDFLRTVDPYKVVIATFELMITMRPCVEQEFDNVERYIAIRPDLADVPNAKSKPILIGFTNNEMGANEEPNDPTVIIEPNYYFFNREFLPKAVDTVRRFYIGDRDYKEEEEHRRANDFLSDFTFLHPTYRTIEKYLGLGATSIYHYMFSYRGDRNYLSTIFNVTDVEGALHADELAYLFDMAMFPDPPTPADQLMIDRMTTLWTNFAKYSTPLPETVDILPVQWPGVTNESMHCLNMKSEFNLQRRAYHDRMAFWDMFYMMFWAIS